MKTKLDRDCIVRRSSGQVSCEIDEQVVALSVEKGSYFQMDEVGSFIWDVLKEPMSVSGLCTKLCSAYEVELSECEVDTVVFLEAMVKAKLIEWDDGSAS